MARDHYTVEDIRKSRLTKKVETFWGHDVYFHKIKNIHGQVIVIWEDAGSNFHWEAFDNGAEARKAIIVRGRRA